MQVKAEAAKCNRALGGTSTTYRQRQVALVQGICPCEAGVDLLRVNVGGLAELCRNVLAVNVHGVQRRKAAGVSGLLCGRLEGEGLDRGGQVFGRHCG